MCALCARAPYVCLACVLHPYVFKRAGLCRSLCVHVCSEIREAGSISKVHLLGGEKKQKNNYGVGRKAKQQNT